MTQKKEDIQKTKDRILAVAIKEFARKGYDGARMSSISRMSGINQALIHYHFQSKEHLYATILERFFEENRFEPLINYMNELSLRPSEKLYLVLYVLLHFHSEHVDLDIYRIFTWEIAAKGEHFRHFVSKFLIPQANFIVDIINEGVRLGEFRTTNPLMVTLSLGMLPDLLTPYWKEVMRGTEWYDMLYGDPSGNEFFMNMADLLFKMLSPAGTSCAVPAISPGIMEGVQALLAAHDEGVKRR